MHAELNRYDPVQKEASKTGPQPASATAIPDAVQWVGHDLDDVTYPFILARPRQSREDGTSGSKTEASTAGRDVLGPVANTSTVLPANVLPFPIRPHQTQRFAVLQKWEGTVSSVAGEEFVAVTRDLTNPSSPDEEVTFSVEEVPEADRPLIMPGAVFYWAVGYELTISGQRKRVSALRFRRLPAWTRSEIGAVRHKAETLKKLFGPHDGTTTATGI